MALTLNGSTNTITGLAVGGLPDGVVDTDMLAANAVTPAKSTVGRLVWLAKKDDGNSGSVDYNSSTTVLDLTSYLSTYDQFFIDLNFHNTGTGSGSLHLYFRFLDASSNVANMTFISNGMSSNDTQATPHNGTNTDYFRPTFAIEEGTKASHQFWLNNSISSDTTHDAHITGQSAWYRSGSGVSFANFAAFATADDKLGVIQVNADAVSGTNTNGRILANLYGVAKT